MSDFSTKTLNRKIVALGKKTEAWRNEVQECLIGCCYQAIVGDSNIDPCIKIIDHLRGSDLKAVMHWLEAHAPVRIKGGSFVFNKSFVGEFDEEALRADPWWVKSIEAKDVSTSLDCLESVRAMVKRLTKEIEQGKKQVVHPEVVAKLAALCNDVEFVGK